jgi:hypothetical protein
VFGTLGRSDRLFPRLSLPRQRARRINAGVIIAKVDTNVQARFDDLELAVGFPMVSRAVPVAAASVLPPAGSEPAYPGRGCRETGYVGDSRWSNQGAVCCGAAVRRSIACPPARYVRS